MSTREQGVALLLALAAIVLVSASTLGFLRAASLEKARSDLDAQTVRADDLLVAADGAIRDWLTTKADAVILPEDAEAPVIAVLDERFEVEGETFAIAILAADQEGMVSWDAVQKGSTVRLSLSRDVRRQIDKTDVPEGVPLGLDLLGADAFPRATADTLPPPLGLQLATHNPAPGRLNVNTAPLSLVRDVYRLQGLGGIDLVEAARAEGRALTVAPRPQSKASKERNVPALSVTSAAWSFRIDLGVGPLRRAWWCVYCRADRDGWTCVQRMLVP